MFTYTKWTSYNGEVGITEKGEYFDLKTGMKLHKEVHQGSIYYRRRTSTKRYSWRKCNETKKFEAVLIDAIKLKSLINYTKCVEIKQIA